MGAGGRRAIGKRVSYYMRRIIISLICGVTILTPARVLAASPTPSPSPSATPSGPATPVPGQTLINEIMANPVGTDTGTEWIELSNLADVPLLIGGMTIVRVSGSTLATVVAGTVIEARGYKKVMATGSVVNGGDTLILKSGATVHDQVTYDSSGAEGQTWNRISLTEGVWSDTPTPEAANAVQSVMDEEESVTSSAASASSGTSSTKKAASTKKVAASKLPKSGPSTTAYLIPPLGWALWRYGREWYRRSHQR